MELIIIAAISDLYGKRVIGKEGKIPWNIPDDTRRFRDLTFENAVIYGRKTAEDIKSKLGNLLPYRYNFVVSRTLTNNDGVIKSSLEKGICVEICRTIEEAIEKSRKIGKTYIAGGAQIYVETINHPNLTRLEITEVKDSYDGDAFFPVVDWSKWTLENKQGRRRVNFLTYVRRA